MQNIVLQGHIGQAYEIDGREIAGRWVALHDDVTNTPYRYVIKVRDIEREAHDDYGIAIAAFDGVCDEVWDEVCG
jgi:hypothetical protein